MPWPQPQAAAAGWLPGAARVVAVLLVALGLSLPFNSSCGWVSYTAWSAFAIVAALVQLAPALGSSFGWSVRTGWMVGAVATGALIGFWVLVALPSITSNASFALTLGVGAATVGCWFSPGRRW
ncbi:MAG: hypothetical protein ACR2P2_22970 [Nakamurella sp.]